MKKRSGPLYCVSRAVGYLGATAALLGLSPEAARAGGTIILGPDPGFCMFVPSVAYSGITANALPFTDTFDQYPLPFSFMPSTNGWALGLGDLSAPKSVADLPASSGNATLFSGNYLNLETEGQTFCNVTTGRAQNVWIDLSVLMVPCEEPPYVDLMAAPQLGFCLDSDNQFNVYCGLSSAFIPSGISFAAGGQKVRLTVQLAYDNALSVPFFRVFLDQTAIRWNAGYRLPDVPSAGGGEWLPCATTNRMFCGLEFKGCGGVDALAFSTTNLGPAVA